MTCENNNNHLYGIYLLFNNEKEINKRYCIVSILGDYLKFAKPLPPPRLLFSSIKLSESKIVFNRCCGKCKTTGEYYKCDLY